MAANGAVAEDVGFYDGKVYVLGWEAEPGAPDVDVIKLREYDPANISGGGSIKLSFNWEDVASQDSRATGLAGRALRILPLQKPE